MKDLLIYLKQIPSFVKVLFLIAIIVRIYAVTLPGFQIDTLDWQIWSERILQTGPSHFYSPNFFADYLPFFYLLLLFISEPFSLIFGFSAIHSNNFIIYFKLINNLFDFLTAVFIFLILRKYDKKSSILAPAFYLINPGIIFNTSVWGQTDSIPTFFLIYSIYLLNEKGRLLKSGILVLFSFLIKPLVLPLVPIMLIKAYLTFSFRKILLTVVEISLLAFVIFLLFFPSNPIHGVFQQFASSLNTYPYTSINAFNFWALVGLWKNDATMFFGLSYKLWGYIIFGVVFLINLFAFLKHKGKNDLRYYLFYALTSFSFFLFLTRIHERHIFPVFALLLISAFIYKSRFLIASYFILSFIFLLNLFYSYYYYEYAYINKHTILDGAFYLVSNHQILLSIFNLLIFFIILAYYFNQQLSFKKYAKTKNYFKRIR